MEFLKKVIIILGWNLAQSKNQVGPIFFKRAHIFRLSDSRSINLLTKSMFFVNNFCSEWLLSTRLSAKVAEGDIQQKNIGKRFCTTRRFWDIQFWNI